MKISGIHQTNHAFTDTLNSSDLLCRDRLHKNKPHLLLIVSRLTMGGTDKFNLDLLQQFIGQEWDVSVATTLDGDHSWMPYFTQYTQDVFILKNFLKVRDYPRFLRRLIQSRQTEAVIVSHSNLGYWLLTYLRAYFPDVTFMDFCHIEEMQWNNGNFPRLSVEYQKLLDLNIVSSEYLKKWMVNQGADPERIEVCYTNVDTDLWRPDSTRRTTVRQQLGVVDSLPVILYAGRICPQKQPQVFARTMLNLQRQNQDFVAFVAGDGPDLDWLRKFIKKHKLSDWVYLLEAVSNQRIKEIMTASDIFFLPSRHEGISLALFEAMACGLPVVAADVGGQRELVTHECGVLVGRTDEKTEVQQYSETLRTLLVNPQRRGEMGEKGRQRVVSHFPLKKMGERMKGLVHQAQFYHMAKPRLTPSIREGQDSATLAVDRTVLQLTAMREDKLIGNRLRRKIYNVFRTLIVPLSRLSVQRGWTGLRKLGCR